MTSTTKVHCPACGVAIKVKEEFHNKQAKCPACKDRFVIKLSPEPSGSTVEKTPDVFCETVEYHATEEHLTFPDSSKSKISSGLGNLGRFQLREVLGQGAYGRVYLAFDPQLDRLVALKVPIFNDQDDAKIQRFLTEARSAARLRHPNIVPTYESGCVDGQYYIASQFIDGQTLAKRVADKKPDFRQAVEWVKQLAEALSYAHAQGVIHRDVKPANIMIDENDAPQIMDFGLAKRLNEDAAMTIDGTIMGTPAYMPPEQARGDTQSIGAHSDQYSLGVILYELLAGRRPFLGPPHAVLADVINTEPPTALSLRPDVPRDLDAVCQVAMNKQIEERYASMEEFANDLRNWLGEIAVKARTPNVLERFVRWTRREPRVAFLVSVVILALVAGATVSSIFAIRANQNLSLAQTNERNLYNALKTANEQRIRADAESARARKAEIDAKAREADAVAAKNEAVKAKDMALAAKLAADEANKLAEQRAQSLLTANEATARATQAQALANEAKTEAIASQRKADYEAKLVTVRLALMRSGYKYARELLESCPAEDRDAKWKPLYEQATNLQAKFISTSEPVRRLNFVFNGSYMLAVYETDSEAVVCNPQSWSTLYRSPHGRLIGTHLGQVVFYNNADFNLTFCKITPGEDRAVSSARNFLSLGTIGFESHPMAVFAFESSQETSDAGTIWLASETVKGKILISAYDYRNRRITPRPAGRTYLNLSELDGQHLLASSLDDNQAVLRDLKTGKLSTMKIDKSKIVLAKFYGGQFTLPEYALYESADSASIAAADNVVLVSNAGRIQSIAAEKKVTKIDVLRPYAAAVCEHHELKIWNYETQSLLQTISSKSKISDIAFLPGSAEIVWANNDGLHVQRADGKPLYDASEDPGFDPLR